ncbi:hypothetical protein LCGC14_2671760 [marine sediment metagenome]|uniref:Uncharacterized protein n=1 Tax=marine sediment metagenome TaxID=412755 RepID=A0A0F9CFU9_9ZZZZ
MRFISGLKKLSKQTILLIIVILFIISWFFLLYARFTSNTTISGYIQIFGWIFSAFTFVLLILSILIPIDKMGIATIIIAAVLTPLVMFMFSGMLAIFTNFSFFANLFIMAFFAFKFCMDASTGLDDYLYRKKGSRKFTRVLEFILFLVLYILFLILIIRYFKSSLNTDIQNLANIFIFVFWINLILMVFVLLRLIFTKKIAAYISLFYLLTFFYIVFLVFDFMLELDAIINAGYNIVSFLIDLFLFIYIIGSIFDRVDYIKEKIKIFRVGTIALFVILMKIYSQTSEITPSSTPVQDLIFQVLVLFWFFVIFTLLVGLYTILAHKEGKRS